MIDEMVSTLKAEQQDDDDKKEYCTMQFDTSDDKKKSLERSVSDLEKSIAKAKEAIAALAEEIKALQEGIASLDKSVAEATEQRKEENKDFTDLMASDAAAKQLLEMAKTRLNIRALRLHRSTSTSMKLPLHRQMLVDMQRTR